MKKVKTLFNSPNDKTGLVNNFTSLQLFVGSVRSSNVEIGFWSGQGTKLDRPGDHKNLPAIKYIYGDYCHNCH